MSSTYSSSDAPSAESPTEALASRYRHLFVLPRLGILLVYSAVASVVLSLTAVPFAGAVLAFPLAFAAVLLSSFIIARVARLMDGASIASFRRAVAAVFVGETVWFVCSALGLLYALAQPSSHSAGNALVFGGLLSAGFEFLVINGAFVERSSVSGLLAAVHPLATVGIFLTLGAPAFDASALIPGASALLIAAVFTPILRLRRTSKGFSSVRLFQAFMKAWANDDSSDLERIIDAHASKTTVSSKVFKFARQTGDVYAVLPGVHPGPFYPVGSYNLPGLISNSFQEIGGVLTLHRPGGHENNLTTNEGAKRYAADLKALAEETRATQTPAIRGPIAAKIGKATASAFAFGDDLLLTVSFAPYGSDDMDPGAERQLAAAAAQSGLDLSLIDAHNSIDGGREEPDLGDQGWSRLIKDTAEAAPSAFRLGYAHSKGTDFPRSPDITTNGIALLLLEVDKTKWALVLADANNAIPSLRKEAADALDAEGYKLLEFCTSDSHDLAARGLTVERGYRALGEATPPTSIVAETVRLARIAEVGLSECRYGSGKLASEVGVFGSEALDEFADVTRRNSRFAKRYAAAAAPLIFILFGAALVL